VETCFFCGIPELVVKGGSIVWSQMGDANASIPTPGPVHGRPMFASFGQSLIKSSFTFLSKNSIDQSIPNKLGLQKNCIAVENTRNINKKLIPEVDLFHSRLHSTNLLEINFLDNHLESNHYYL